LNTEATLQYYDIFVRNAFGSYRDILKQVAFSPKMGEMLSSINNKSYQYLADRGNPAYPDENFAREIMQLFSIGLVKLNMDGSVMLDDEGNPFQTYDNEDIMSYSRAWTGLKKQASRGNNDGIASRVDPMFLEGPWRDSFPKSDLQGGYIGDRYPLCVDQPAKQFLRRGATYRLLGGKANPELQRDIEAWESDPEVVRLKLKATNSPLYKELCADQQGQGCTFPGKVVISENLVYDESAKLGAEYGVDTIRTVLVQDGANSIFYEYVRPPCVEHAFFQNGNKVEKGLELVGESMCADPRRDAAAGKQRSY
jgi:hypothetical protein